MRAAIIAAVFVSIAGPVVADPVYCSVWQGIRTCSGPDDYHSTETQWQGLVTGQDSDGNRWTRSRWRDIETTTVAPRQER
jgi:hypothetical protein